MTETTNPLLKRLRIPGATFRLPSQGILYTNGELDQSVKNGEVEVNPLTAIDEIALSSSDKLISGKAVTEVISRCIPQVLKPELLLNTDVEFLLVALRIVTFGDVIEVQYQHTCDGAKEHTYKVNLQAMSARARPLDPTAITKEYTITLPNEQVVVLRPLIFSDVIALVQSHAELSGKERNEIPVDQEELMQFANKSIAAIVMSVDGITNQEQIREWVSALPLGYKRQIEQTAHAVTRWGVDTTSKQVCADCKAKIDVPVIVNPVSFFT